MSDSAQVLAVNVPSGETTETTDVLAPLRPAVCEAIAKRLPLR